MRSIQTIREFGNAVRQARQERELSQADLARLAGVSRPWLSELETGKLTVELGRVLRVLSALELAITLSPVPRPGPGRVDLDQLLDDLDHGR